jgi:ABC-2 type transport system ATP-binding protein
MRGSGTCPATSPTIRGSAAGSSSRSSPSSAAWRARAGRSSSPPASTGNRQKIGLIQAAFHAPELLILDEPTSGLDPLMQEEFLAFVAEERDRGHTVLLSSHELDEVERACDRDGIIRAGRMIAVERVSDLTGRSYRHVTLELADAIDPDEFRRIPGVIDLARAGARLSFKATGPLDAVIKQAARHTVTDIELTHPTLEEVFLTYYGREAAG